ncbi:MAG: DUF1292 domain-containing protein [Clostridiales bacterium]|nr:DUF1292 domain-containing protein [Clostridiales bacterium]
MAEDKRHESEEELYEEEIFTLTDEEGVETQFALLGSCEYEGNTYLALMPVDGNDDDYVILRIEVDEDGEEILATIEDDDEFDKVADLFEDELFSDIDHDAE